MRSHEKALEQQTAVAESSAALAADAGGREPHGRIFDKLFSANYVAAGRGYAAAGVFNKRACHEIDTELRGLVLAGELTVAVVYHDCYIWSNTFDSCAYIAYFLGREGFAVFIAS